MSYRTRTAKQLDSRSLVDKDDDGLTDSESQITDVEDQIDPDGSETENTDKSAAKEARKGTSRQTSSSDETQRSKLRAPVLTARTSSMRQNKTNNESDRSGSRSSNTISFKWFLLVIVIAITAGIASYYDINMTSLQSETPDENAGKSKWQIVSEYMKKKRTVERFRHSVTNRSLRTLQRSIQDTVDLEERNSDKMEPLVMLVVSSRNNRNSSCLVQEIKDIFERVGGRKSIEMDGRLSTPEDIHNLEDQFEGDAIEVAVIHSITEMNHQAFLKIHKYANHGDSVHRKLVLILTAHSEKVNSLNPQSSGKEIDDILQDLFNDAYKATLGSENLEKMASRLTDKPIILLSTGSSKSACD